MCEEQVLIQQHAMHKGCYLVTIHKFSPPTSWIMIVTK